jgi:hypothetical protein
MTEQTKKQNNIDIMPRQISAPNSRKKRTCSGVK